MTRISRTILLLLMIEYAPAIIAAQPSIRFAVIGDYGYTGQPERDVADLVKRWNPDFIITVGDNNYENGAASTIDPNIGQYYHEFISPYTGSYGDGDTINRFFPTLGNHDWNTSGATPFLNYFTLPGNERYYDFVKGPVHFFAIDSDPHEPDGKSKTSVQALWLREKLSSSAMPWKIVFFHHPPFSSGTRHGSDTTMQWPFRQWGATAIFAGHEHNYERFIINTTPYFVNGLGGRSIYAFGATVPNSNVRYNGDYGAMLVEADLDRITFKFITRRDSLIDSYTINSWVVRAWQEITGTPTTFSLSQNYPNPFNATTDVRYAISDMRHVSLKVYDVLGREVATLVNETKQAGDYTVTWDASGFPSGMYYYRLTASDFIETKKLVLMK